MNGRAARQALELTARDVDRQSLAKGSMAAALLHIERALTGTGNWSSAHAHIRQVASGPIDSGPHAGLFYGAPAVVFILHAARSGDPRYQVMAQGLDKHVARVVKRRLATADERMRRRTPASSEEFDLFGGLTGLGALLLLRAPESDLLAGVLDYMIRLSKPRRLNGIELPGWWVDHDPDPQTPAPGGHASFGLAHGAAGPLALLSLAALRGCKVPGQSDAINRLWLWFDRWRHSSPEGLWWPKWLTRDELYTGRTGQQGPGRPSWCDGTPGIARALQLAALATRDPLRRGIAERAMVECLTDQQLHKITQPGLSHGIAGVYQTAFRAAADATNPAISRRLPVLAAALARHSHGQIDATGLPHGPAGVALALETARHAAPPRSDWDACLLITPST